MIIIVEKLKNFFSKFLRFGGLAGDPVFIIAGQIANGAIFSIAFFGVYSS